MGSAMTMGSTVTTYSRHSQDHAYTTASQAFLDRQPLGHVQRCLDIACGDGAVSQMLLERAPQASLMGLDIDPVQIRLATERFVKLGYAVRHDPEAAAEWVPGKPSVIFAQAAFEDTPAPDAGFDCITVTNAIHLVPDKESFVAAVARRLLPGGMFGFNTVFYAGTICDGTHEFYTEWLKAALGYVETLSERRLAQGQPGIRRVRAQGRRAFQNVWLSPADWCALLSSHGIATHDVHERELELDAEFFASAGSYAGLAEVLLSGYPVEIAAEALGATAAEAMATVHRATVPRRWLEVWAAKT